MPKQTQKTIPGDALTPEEMRARPGLPLGYGRVSNIRASSPIAAPGGGGGSAGGGGGSGTVITISTTEGEYWKIHYPVHEPALSFGSGVRVFGRVANGWVSGGRVEIVADAEEVEVVGIGEVIPLKAYSEGVGNTPTSTSTATAVGILVCIKSQTSRTTTTTTGNPVPSLRIQILDATAEGTLTLWGPTATAANSAGWTPFSTALYITSARVSMFNGGVQISLTRSSTLLALLVSSPPGASLRQHLLRTYPHTRLQLPPVVWPTAGVKLLFTLAEFSAHASSRAKSRRRVMGEPVVISGYLSLIVMGAELVLLFKRNMLFLGSCGGECIYTSTPNNHACTSATNNRQCTCTWSPNPSILSTLTDETGTIPGTALIFSQKAWDSLLTPDLASKSIQELARLESQLAYTRFSFAVVWDSTIGALYVCDVS